MRSIKADLSADWADRANTEAAIRSKIKRLLRKRKYQPPAGPGGGDPGEPGSGRARAGLDEVAQLIFEQARSLYRFWPDVENLERSEI